MQVTGGQFKGAKLISPIGARSTLSVTREGVFNILNSYFGKCGGECGNNFSGLKFLDAFTGSGIMAIEAHSRGFEVLAIEKNVSCLKIAKENFKKLDLEPAVIKGDAIKVMKKLDEKFDVIYLDPPWNMDYTEILTQASEKLKSGGVIVCESEKKKNIILPENLKLLKEKTYGRGQLSIVGQF